MQDAATISWPFPVLRRVNNGVVYFTRSTCVWVWPDGSIQRLGEGMSLDRQPEIADFTHSFAIAGDRGYFVAFGAFIDLSTQGISFKACANYKGQLLIGNGKVPNSYSLNADKTVSKDTVVEGKTLVAWSKINCIDFDFDLSNEAGFTFMPWHGEVWSLKVLGDSVMAYGDKGIAKLEPVSEPTYGYSTRLFSSFGIISPRAVDGDEKQHVFIGEDSELYLVEPRRALSDAGYSPKKLGFGEFIRGMKDPIVSYDPMREHWWISSSTRAFVLSRQGMGESTQIVTSLCGDQDGKLLGISAWRGGREALVRTHGVSFGTRGIKLLATVEADIACEGGKAECAVYWSSDYAKGYSTPGFIPFDPRGNCFPMVSGSQFEIAFRTTDFTTTRLSKAWLRYKVTDKNAVRGGLNVSPTYE